MKDICRRTQYCAVFVYLLWSLLHESVLCIYVSICGCMLKCVCVSKRVSINSCFKLEPIFYPHEFNSVVLNPIFAPHIVLAFVVLFNHH